MMSRTLEPGGIESVFDDARAGSLLVRSRSDERVHRLAWAEGRVTELTRCETEAEADPTAVPWLVPSVFDLQVNGYGGVDFQAREVALGELEYAVRCLKTDGCGAILVTLITDDWGEMLRKLRHLVGLRAQSADLTRFIAGWHLEGPFLSAEEGFRGAHSAAAMMDPPAGCAAMLRDLVGDSTLLMTVAPERSGVMDLIREGRQVGIRFSLGHSAADGETVRQAVAAGTEGITHFGNGVPQLWPRHDNWFWSVLDCSRLFVGLIPDGIHLPGPVFRGMHRALGGHHAIYYTTDAMAAAGAGPGIYPLGKERLQVGEDQVVRQPGRPNYAGSALRPLDGFARAVQMLSGDWPTLWDGFSSVPAQWLGGDAGLGVGRWARFTLVWEDAGGKPMKIQTQYAADGGANH